MRLPLVALVLCSWFTAPAARADFGARSEFWDGGSRFIEEARRESGEIVPTQRLDLERLTPNDAIVLLAPDGALPVNDLVRFARTGGHLVVLDDFGSAGELLSRFGIARVAVDLDGAVRLRDQAALLVATRQTGHPLTDGVPALLTNRPAALAHPALHGLFSVGQSPIVLTGVVGSGRVVAIADPSIFLNEMMALAPNRRFARNLVRFVGGGESPRRVYVVIGNASFEGSFGATDPGTLRERLEAALADLARLRLPDDALRVLAACLAVVCLILLGLLRDTRVEPARPWLDAGDEVESEDDRTRAALREAVALVLRRRRGVDTRDDAGLARQLAKLSTRARRTVVPALFSRTPPSPEALARAIRETDRLLADRRGTEPPR